MRKRLCLLAFFLPLACKGGFSENTGWNPVPPADGGDAKAQALIDQVWAAMGANPAFKSYGELRYTWNVKESDKLVKSENFFWDRFEHRMRFEENSAEGNMIAVRVILDKPGHGIAYKGKRNTGGGQGLQQAAKSDSASGMGSFERLPTAETPRIEEAASKAFAETRRWLLGPLNLRDKGIHVKYSEEAQDTMGPDKKKYLALVVTFDEGADWPSPKDTVIWQIDPDTKLPAWMLWKQGDKEGFSAWSQEDYKDVGGGLKLAMSHKGFNSPQELQFANVQLNQRPDDDLYFEAVNTGH
jgi:hypothetical protein